jgi:hypothetical protein
MAYIVRDRSGVDEPLGQIFRVKLFKNILVVKVTKEQGRVTERRFEVAFVARALGTALQKAVAVPREQLGGHKRRRRTLTGVEIDHMPASAVERTHKRNILGKSVAHEDVEPPVQRNHCLDKPTQVF